jgi:hypothetical protein
MTPIGAETVEDLTRKLACRAKHEDAATLAHRRPGISGETVQQRQRESGRFAGSGLSNSDHVAARHHYGDRLLLDRSSGGVVFLCYCERNRFVEAEAMKGGQ